MHQFSRGPATKRLCQWRAPIYRHDFVNGSHACMFHCFVYGRNINDCVERAQDAVLSLNQDIAACA